MSLSAVLGVIVAVEVVKNMNAGTLQWIVGLMIIYTGVSFLREFHKLGGIESVRHARS